MKSQLWVASVLLLCFGQLQAANVTAENLTLSDSLSFGLVSINDEGASYHTVPGFRMIVSQETTSEVFTNTIYYPDYSTTETVYTDEYGWVEVGGYYQDHYEYGVVNSYWVDDVYVDNGYYDENNNWVSNPELVTPGYMYEEYGDMYVGQEWIEGGQEWQVIYTSMITEEVWHEGYSETQDVEYTGFQRPKIKLAATRTDANWVWQVPDVDHNDSSLRDIFVLFDGGVKIPSRDANVNMALLSDNLTYSRAVSGTDFNATKSSKSSASEVVVKTAQVFTDSTKMDDEASLEAQKLTFTYAYTNAQNQTVTKQTQISATGASLNGLVTMKGNVNVEGTMRVEPAGNLSMAGFEEGPRPLPVGN